MIGSEAARTRPGVIVSNDAANTTAARLGRGAITVVPVTSNIDRLYPFQVLIPAEETGCQGPFVFACGWPGVLPVGGQ